LEGRVFYGVPTRDVEGTTGRREIPPWRGHGKATSGLWRVRQVWGVTFTNGISITNRTVFYVRSDA
jgi:hypothetical protein